MSKCIGRFQCRYRNTNEHGESPLMAHLVFHFALDDDSHALLFPVGQHAGLCFMIGLRLVFFLVQELDISLSGPQSVELGTAKRVTILAPRHGTQLEEKSGRGLSTGRKC